MIYLIHFEPPIGRTNHYLGVTREDRLPERLREHALGNGATLIRVAVKTGRRLWLARTFPGAGPELEQTMKRHGHFKMMCPLCCPIFAALKSKVYEIDTTRPEQPPVCAVLEWRAAPSAKPPQSMKKGPA